MKSLASQVACSLDPLVSSHARFASCQLPSCSSGTFCDGFSFCWSCYESAGRATALPQILFRATALTRSFPSCCQSFQASRWLLELTSCWGCSICGPCEETTAVIQSKLAVAQYLPHRLAPTAAHSTFLLPTPVTSTRSAYCQALAYFFCAACPD